MDSKIHANKADRDHYATPVVYGYKGNRRLLFVKSIGIASAELDSGNQLWSHNWPYREIEYGVDPLVFENQVFVSTSFSCALLEIRENESKVLWQNMNLRANIYNSVLIDGYLYRFKDKHDIFSNLRCINWKTGNLMWKKKMKSAQLIFSKR